MGARPAKYTYTPIPTPFGTRFKTLAFSTPIAKNEATLPRVILNPLEIKEAVMGVG